MTTSQTSFMQYGSSNLRTQTIWPPKNPAPYESVDAKQHQPEYRSTSQDAFFSYGVSVKRNACAAPKNPPLFHTEQRTITRYAHRASMCMDAKPAN